MGENGEKKQEMSPQEDGSKVPLTDGNLPHAVDKAKSGVNGDAKIDMGKSAALSGLTKEQLSAYENDPFWVRLRWSLFILFWLVWILMLVFAIVIIVRAPKCEPPPELLWIQEGALIEFDESQLPLAEQDLLDILNAQSVSSVYFPNLINIEDYEQSNYDVDAIIKTLVEKNFKVVTNMPTNMPSNNILYANFTQQKLIGPNGDVLYSNVNLTQAMYENVAQPWMEKGVKGFLIPDQWTSDIERYVKDMNVLLVPGEGSMSNDIKSEDVFVKDPFVPSNFREFLMDETDYRSFYRFSSSENTGSTLSADAVRLLDIALYLFPGSPILKYGVADNATNTLLQGLAEFRLQDGIKFGETYFSNTTQDVIAFTRVYKGTPAYAIALNFGSANETVSFLNTTNVAESGTVELHSTHTESQFETRTKTGLDSIMLAPFEGKVMQFVANFG